MKKISEWFKRKPEVFIIDEMNGFKRIALNEHIKFITLMLEMFIRKHDIPREDPDYQNILMLINEHFKTLFNFSNKEKKDVV